MTAAKRSALMARIHGFDTKPERLIAELLDGHGLAFEQHPRDLPGRPDFVFRDARIAVFVDGDFWHGWRFSLWQHKLSPKWREKIESNRRRDQRNFRKLRRMSWGVVRVWEHQVEQSLESCASRIFAALHRGRL